MDFHSLSRRELQSLCKKNKTPANITNVAMADALASLTNVEGLEEIGNQETVLQSPQTCRSARTRPTKEIDSSSIALSRPRRGTIRKGNQEEEEKENKDPNVMLKTPASRVTGRRRAVAVGGSSVSLIAEEKEKSSVVTQVYSTRRSTRLSEKKASELVPKKVEKRNEVISMSALSEEESDDIVKQFASDEKEKIEENKGDSVEVSEVHSSEVVSVNDQLIPDETPEVEIGQSVDGIQVADSAVDRDLAVRNCTAKDNTNWESEELTLGDADASADVSSPLSEGGGISVNSVAPSTPEKTEGKESNEIANQDGLYTSVSVDIHGSITGFGIEQLTPEKTTHSEANNNVVSYDASDADDASDYDTVDFESSSDEGSLSIAKIDVAEDYQILESEKAGDLGSNVAAASKVSGEIGSRIESSVENPPSEQHTNLEFYLAGSMEPLSCENVKSDESVLMASSVEFSVEMDSEKSATDLLENDYLWDDDWEVEVEVPVETKKFIRNEDGDVNESIGSRTPISYSATDSIVSRVPVSPNNTPASASRLVLSQNMVTPKSSNTKKSTAVSKMVLEVFDEDKEVNNTVARSLKNKSRLDIVVSAEDTPTAKTVKKVADDNKENNNSGGFSLKNKARVNEVVAAGEKNNTKNAEDAKKALENKSLRVLKKLYKEKLANANNVKEEFLEKARPALQTLTENCLVDGREN